MRSKNGCPSILWRIIELQPLPVFARSPHLPQKLMGPLAPSSGPELREMALLSGVSGRLVPGQFTLLLGPPGSGKVGAL